MHTPQVAAPDNTTSEHSARQWLAGLKKWGTLGLFVLVIGFLIVVVLPTLLGDRTVVIISGSMEPTIHMGAAAVLQPVPSRDLHVGDVVAHTPAAKGAIPVVHRIVNITERNGERYYQTKGDANATADANEFTLSTMAYRLWYNIPLAGYAVAFASSRIGVVSLIAVPLLVLGLLKLQGWRKNRRALQSRPARER